MLKPPAIDLLFRALITGDTETFKVIQTERAAECAHVRSVVSTEDEGGVDLGLGLHLSSTSYVVPFFSGPRAFFLSAAISVETRLNGGRSSPLIDFSLGFDSNFAEKLRAFIANERIQDADRARVVEVLMLKARDSRVQFDVMPFLIENTRLSRENPSNARPLNTLISFRMLDHLDWEAFRTDPGSLVFDRPRSDLIRDLRRPAEAYLAELEASREIRRNEVRSAATRALLMRFARLWHGQAKRDKNRILGDLLHFALKRLSAIPLTELRLIWSGMTSASSSRFFGPITGRSTDMMSKIRGMAWDMTLLRYIESSATARTGGSFFIPYFVSIDEKWRELLRENPVELMLADDMQERALFARRKELEFQLALEKCVTDEVRSEMTAEKIEARRKRLGSLELSAMEALVADEERHWNQDFGGHEQHQRDR